MKLFLLTVVIIVSTRIESRIETGVLDAFGNVLDNPIVEDTVDNPIYNADGDKGLGVGFNGNIGRRYGANLWQNSLLNRQRSITNDLPYTTSVASNNNANVDPEVAKRYPAMVAILNQLKELNRLKAEGKLAGGNRVINNDNNEDVDELKKILQNTTTNESNESIDPKVAKLFPKGVELLNRLKELNKLKKDGKLLFDGNKFVINSGNSKPTKNDNNDGKNDSNNSHNKKDDSKIDNNGKNDPKNGTKNIDMLFQAQPVVPEN